MRVMRDATVSGWYILIDQSGRDVSQDN